MKKVVAALVLASILPGCTIASEYWHKPNKYKPLPQSDFNPAVATLSLDASRRLVISQRDDSSDENSRYTCPEPPPDIANNTLAQTLASAEAEGKLSGSLGSAYQSIAQVLANRSSTVEFWRTTSSTYCVLLMNGETVAADKYLTAAITAIAETDDKTVTAQAAAALIDALARYGAMREPAANGNGSTQTPSSQSPATEQGTPDQGAQARGGTNEGK